MKILITGGCGFVGTNLILSLKKKFNVCSLDNLSRKGSKYNYSILKKNKIKNYNFDISKYEYFKRLPEFDIIIDCCAEAAIEKSKTNLDKVISTNLTGTINILKKAKKICLLDDYISNNKYNVILFTNRQFIIPY